MRLLGRICSSAAAARGTQRMNGKNITADLTSCGRRGVDGKGEEMCSFHLRIESMKLPLGLFTILKMILVLYVSKALELLLLLVLELKSLLGQTRRANLIGALKGKLSRHDLILP